jgi:hypothetical protein
MTYVLIGLIALLLVACTIINVGMEPPATDTRSDRQSLVNVQSSQNIDVLGSQNSEYSPKAARGDAVSTDTKDQTAETTSLIPITAPINLP